MQATKIRHGWLNLVKPIDISSAHLVAKVKRILGKEYKIGHTGTLDPKADGVLPLALGEATKLTSYLVDAQKTYQFTICFGKKTSTGDIEGEVIEVSDYIPTQDECEKVALKFLGDVTQIPPKYSALKVNGQRAYKLAREGKEVDIKPRVIKIYSCKLLEYDGDKGHATYVVTCSKGTYIRTLAEDISKSLKTSGFVLELHRLRVGDFDIANAINLKDLPEEQLAAKKMLLEKLLRVESVLADIPELEIDDITADRIRFGQKISIDHGDLPQVAIMNKNQLVAIGSISSGCFQSQRVFNL